MFKVGDRVKLDLERLWEAEAFSAGGPGYGITCEGLRLVKVDKPLYHYALYHPDGQLKACDTDRLGIERIEGGVVFLENDVALSLPEAELCLEKVQEKAQTLFMEGDRVILDLEKLWKNGNFRFSDLDKCATSGGHYIIKDEDTPYEYMIYSARNGAALAGHLNQLNVLGVGEAVVFLENGIVLSLPEAELCLEKVPKKENSFEGLFEELADAVTLDEVQRCGIRLYQKDYDADGVNYDVNIYSYQDKNWFIAYKNCECIAFHEHDGEVPQKKALETPRKKVVQISVDVEIDADEKGHVVAEQIAEELEGCGRVVLDAAFREDMSLEYDYEVEI